MVLGIRFDSVLFLETGKNLVQREVERLVVRVLYKTHVQPYNRIFFPFRLMF